MVRKKKEEISEDWCFVCKEGGDLLLCEHKDCLKSYHPKCVGKDDSVLNSQEIFKCDWHSCSFCKKAAKFHCFCCPYAICGKCLPDAEFVVVQGIKGFCNNCLRFALLWEEKRDEDSDGGKVDFTEGETCEFLFMDYWEIVKRNEGLTLEILQKASGSLKKGRNKMIDEIDEIGKIDQDMPNGLNLTNYDDWEWNAIEDYVPSGIGRKRKSKALSKNGGECKLKPKKQRSSRKEFLEWGSKPLIEFLGSLGIDTKVGLSPFDVLGTITKYIDEEKLLHPQRKKTIVCDQRLLSLLGRRLVNKHRLYSLIQEHYAENQEDSDDGVGCKSEQSEEIASKSCSQKKISRRNEQNEERALKSCSKKKKSHEKGSQTKESLMVKGCMASIVGENIKLAFLKRSVVEELLKQPEAFEGKVIGSFLRVKSDPYDYMQPYSHQLVQVTGIKKLSTEGAKVATLFQVSSMPVDISVDMLSESDFTKEECNQLNQKIKDGVHKKLTVVELEQKARQLYEEIMKHWITKELVLLKNRIDKANETGQRRDLMEYTERRNLLLLPHEQLRLMNEIPEVIAEVIAEDMNLDNERTKLMSDALSEDSLEREATGVISDKEAVYSSVFAGEEDLRTFEVKEQSQEHQEGVASDKEAVTLLFSAGNEDLRTFEVKEQSQEHQEGVASDKEAVTLLFSAGNEDLRTFEVKEQSQEHQEGVASDKEAITSSFSAGNEAFRTFEEKEQSQKHQEGAVSDKAAATSSVFAENRDLWALEVKEPTQEIKGGDGEKAVTSPVSAGNGDLRTLKVEEQTQESRGGDACDIEAVTSPDLAANDDVREFEARELTQKNTCGSHKAIEIIDLSSDDDDDNERMKLKSTKDTAMERESEEWYIMGPTREVRGPFQLLVLQKWKEFSGKYANKFKVWRKGQSPETALPLPDVCS